MAMNGARLPTFEIETEIGGRVAGVDEAGRGPLAGPVVAAAVVLCADKIPDGVRDSKTVPEKERESLYDALMGCAEVSVGIASVAEIDEINILHASMLAMTRAVEGLKRRPKLCLIDGNRAPALKCKARPVIGGDAKSFSIAAASLIAKVTRDRIMCELAQEFPFYAWEKNKGYGVAAHLAAMKQHGVTPHHRRSFAPVHNMLYADSDLVTA